MKQQAIRHTSTVLWGTVMMLAAQSSPAALLINESFDDVTGLTSSAVRTVSDILTNNPGQLPSGTLWATTNLTQGTPAADVNVRQGDNTINTTTGSTGFDLFFSPGANNKFLVLGDQAGVIGDVPDGGPLGQAIAFAMPFTIGPGGSAVSFDFDWAFDGFDNSVAAAQQDRFMAGIIGGTGLNLASFLSGNPATAFAQLLLDRTSPTFGTGHVSSTVNLAQGSYLLAFVQLEALNGSSTNSAVGIDNINVAAVPVPAAVWLLGSAFTALVSIGRRRSE
ncbi:MAG: hypothetical protein U1F34_07115 [Gammaproteobacteria bacterium]